MLLNMPLNPDSRRRTAEGMVTLLKVRSTELLVTLRNGKRLSQRQLAAALTAVGKPVSKSHIADLERGARQPSYDIGLRIAAFYGLPMDILFDEVPLEYGQPA